MRASARVAASSARSGERGVEARRRIVAGGGEAGGAEGVEHPHRPEAPAGTGGDAGVLPLRIDAHHRARGGQQVGQDGADALAGAGGGEGEEVGGAGVAQRRAAPILPAPDEEGGSVAGEGRGGEVGRDLPRVGPGGGAHDVGGWRRAAEGGEEGEHGHDDAGGEGAEVPNEAAPVFRHQQTEEGEDDKAAEQADDAADGGAQEGGAEAPGEADAVGDEEEGRPHAAVLPAVSPIPCGVTPAAAAASRSAAKARSPARRQRASRSRAGTPGAGEGGAVESTPASASSVASAASSPSRIRVARSRKAPRRVARSSPVRSTRPALATRPPSSMRWRVRSRRARAQSRVSSRARATSALAVSASLRRLARRSRSSSSRRPGRGRLVAVRAGPCGVGRGGGALAAKEGGAALAPALDGLGVGLGLFEAAQQQAGQRIGVKGIGGAGGEEQLAELGLLLAAELLGLVLKGLELGLNVARAAWRHGAVLLTRARPKGGQEG